MYPMVQSCNHLMASSSIFHHVNHLITIHYVKFYLGDSVLIFLRRPHCVLWKLPMILYGPIFPFQSHAETFLFQDLLCCGIGDFRFFSSLHRINDLLLEQLHCHIPAVCSRDGKYQIQGWHQAAGLSKHPSGCPDISCVIPMEIILKPIDRSNRVCIPHRIIDPLF